MHRRAVISRQESVADHLKEPETLLFRCITNGSISKRARVEPSGITHISMAAARMFMAYFVGSLSNGPGTMDNDGT